MPDRISDESVAQFRKNLADTQEARAKARSTALKSPREPWVAEPESPRLERFTRRLAAAEAVRGTADFQPVAFLSEGFRASDAVAYVRGQYAAGSGFMISPRLFITNQHVIRDAAEAARTTVTFRFQDDGSGRPLGSTCFTLRPDLFFLASPEVGGLDYAIVAIGPRCNGAAELDAFGFCPLGDQDDKHAIGMPVNIVQHPNQRPKEIVVRKNLLAGRIGDALLYETDTDVGSSGSPVFNDEWRVIALHHYGEPFLATLGGVEYPSNVNEGVRVSSIVRDLHRLHDQLSPPQQALLDEALIAGATYAPPAPAPAPVVHHVAPIPLPAIESAAPAPPREVPMTSSSDQVLRVTVPIEITVRVGGASPSIAIGEPSPLSPPPAAPAVVKRAEKAYLDPDYSNRQGYDENFLGTVIPLPKVSQSLVAPLLSTEPDYKEGELKYHHFSIKMHRTRGFALFTATNIDATAYVGIDRDTGLPKAEGGERWNADPRIDDKYLVLQPFYSASSTYFDRGHLTRRNDPTWGTPDMATYANGDTFHFTNCTPQHFRFNEATKYWQGIEQTVLELGAIAANKKVIVFQGPVLNGDYAPYNGVDVPMEFWKIAVWEGDQGIRASGFKISQEKLIAEPRNRNVNRNISDINVNPFRARISDIETLTGLKFSDAVRNGDTYPKKVPIGAEAAGGLAVRTWEDCL